MGIPILVTRHRYIEAAPRKCLPVLTTTHLSRRIWDNVFEVCFRSAIMVMLHGGVAWGPKRNSELQRLCRNDRNLIRWICGTRDETPSAALLQKIRIEDITPVLRSRRLNWYGHVQRATSCINSITNFPIPGTRKQGKPSKTWSGCVKTGVSNCGLAGVDPQGRDAWTVSVRHGLVQPTP